MIIHEFTAQHWNVKEFLKVLDQFKEVNPRLIGKVEYDKEEIKNKSHTIFIEVELSHAQDIELISFCWGQRFPRKKK